MSHQASSAGLSYLSVHCFRDWFDNNVSVKGLLFAWCLFVSVCTVDVNFVQFLTQQEQVIDHPCV